MKFKINKKLLENKLSKINATIVSSNIISIPTLKGILFEVTYDKLEMIGSNGKVSIKTTVVQNEKDLVIESTGGFLIPSKNIVELIKKIDSTTIQMEMLEENVLTIATNKSKFTINTIDKSMYPEIDFKLKGTEISFKKELFKTIATEIIFAADMCNKQQNEVFKGINYISGADSTKIVATNAHRLAIKQLHEKGMSVNIIMQPEVFKLTPKLMETSAIANAFISKDKTQINLEGDILQFQNLQGTYPDVSKIIPKKLNIALIVNREELEKALDRINLLTTDEKRVRMQIKSTSLLLISQQNTLGSVVEKIDDFNKIGEDIDISFSAAYLQEAVHAIKSTEIKLEFESQNKPFIIWDGVEKHTLHLISPYRNN